MNFKEHESQQKLTGRYYTAPETAAFLAQWISEISPESVLEPACGGGVFLYALNEILGRKGSHKKVSAAAVDVDDKALSVVRGNAHAGSIQHIDVELINDDFLNYSMCCLNTKRNFDAVIGNPPFIRYQYLEKKYQERTELIFQDANLKFTKHTNAWVPFVLQGVRLLRPGGRLAMVVPAEIMHVLHANSLRRYLIETCKDIAVVHLEDLFSGDVLQGIVLLLCSKKDARDPKPARITFPHTSNGELHNGKFGDFVKSFSYVSADHFDYKWMEGLLTPDELEVYEKARALPDVYKFSQLASASVGIVTGANKFFLVTDQVVEKFGLSEFVYPMFGRSSHVKGVRFLSSDVAENRLAGLPTNFVDFPSVPKDQLPKGMGEYVEIGESQQLHTRYKCRIREPWYKVPHVWAADIAMLKRAHETPRLILNEALAYTTDTAYRITMHEKRRDEAPRLIWNFVNSLTALSAELEGRHYGGGVIELVPSEILRLAIPFAAGGEDELLELTPDFRSSC